jgi:hypothetical protein
MRKSVFVTLAILASQFACKPDMQAREAACPLAPGDYGVQTVMYQGDHGTYELMVLNAPACFHQPLKLKSLQLAQLGDTEKEKKVKLTYGGDENSTLYMTEDFQIKMTQTVTENGVRKEQSGSWSPFLTGLAGGVAGGVIGGVAGSMMSRAFNKPQHYTPPPMQAGNTNLRGFGGVGDTREGAARSYQQNYSSRPNTAPAAAGLSGGGAKPAETKSSFFRSKSESSTVTPQSGAARSYQPARSTAPKRNFFKSRRR